MLIKIIAIGKHMPAWITAGFEEYANRIPSNYRIQLIEIVAEKRTQNADTQKIMQLEEKKISAVTTQSDYCIALDRLGKSLDTKTLAKHLQTWHDNQQSICFVIGGPEGLSTTFLKKVNGVWSLSSMTLPHSLVRVVLAEQIYRAWSIIVNHPYHR